jgi:hydrocephalus-inducing protein
MKTIRMVRPSEYRKIMRQREEEERKRREEAEAAALAAQKGKKAGKPPAKKEEAHPVDDDPVDESEDPTEELIETIPEPENAKVEGSEKNVALKTTLVCDFAKYECSVKEIDFKPTLMYASRTFKFTIKNTALIELFFNFRIVNANTGILDAGPYTVVPKKGSIAPGCDDNFLVKFSPMEVEDDFTRILSANILNLDPESMEPLIIEVNGVAERPVIHFELPPSSYRDRKAKDMTPIDPKFKIVEFDSLGTNIKNTRRFMAVNPTASGYEFEWSQV